MVKISNLAAIECYKFIAHCVEKAGCGEMFPTGTYDGYLGCKNEKERTVEKPPALQKDG